MAEAIQPSFSNGHSPGYARTVAGAVSLTTIVPPDGTQP